MKIFEKAELDSFLELPLVASSFVDTGIWYGRIHDDNEGNSDQCLKMCVLEHSGNEVFYLKTPTNLGLRFRNYAGGGSNLHVHNALKVLIYASLNKEPLLPGLERKSPPKAEILRNINEILEGVIVLPAEVFTGKEGPHYFFEILPHLTVAIAVDGDTHLITEMTTELERQIREETTLWNPKPFIFEMKSNCSRNLYNSLILLAIATKQSRR